MEGMVVNGAFWHGRKVLVTGHTGFKGGWLCTWLQSLGTHVAGYALPPSSEPSYYRTARVEEGVRSYIADIADLATVRRAFGDENPEIVFHLAAQPLVRESYNDPIGTYRTNVIGTANVLEAVRTTESVRVVVVITTDKCYENREWCWGYREDDVLGGFDPYSSSKACAELVTSAYRRSFFSSSHGEPRIGIATARAGNVIGGGDWAIDRLVPDIVKAAISNQSVRVRNPESVRPWQHVLEPLSGYLMLAERIWSDPISFSGAWNFGPHDSDARTVGYIVEHFAKYWPGVRTELARDPSSVHEARYLKLDISKVRAALGWVPRWTVAEAIEKTVEWYRGWHIGTEDMRSASLRQISAYAAR